MLVDIPKQFFALSPQLNFPANNLNFTEGEADGIKFRLVVDKQSYDISTHFAVPNACQI